jgi:hypothetical protein
MATTSLTKKSKKTTASRSRGRRSKTSRRFTIGRLISYGTLLLLLVGSLCVAGYVIFFRVAVASASPSGLVAVHLSCPGVSSLPSAASPETASAATGVRTANSVQEQGACVQGRVAVKP